MLEFGPGHHKFPRQAQVAPGSENQHISFPELDLRQRLTAWKEYGVAEIFVGKSSDLPGKSIAESGLREQDIAVLELKSARESVVPNPKPTRTLKVGDKLLCFGKLEAMRAFTAPRKRRRPSKLNRSKISQAQSRVRREEAAGETESLPPVGSVPEGFGDVS